MAKREDKFQIDGSEDDIAGVPTRHPNRNEDKSRERSVSDDRRKSVAIAKATGPNEKEMDNHVRKETVTDQHFFVLILSKKNAKLFRGDLSGLKALNISELPNGIEDVVHLEEKGQNLYRTGSGTGASNAHGMGGGQPDEKDNISMYLKEVDRTLWKEGLNREKAPLILGGVDYIVAIYKDIAQYKHIMSKSITGNLENEDPKEIYKKAMEILNPVTA